jgi:uncharacterized protein YbjT (DUF2867 family)
MGIQPIQVLRAAQRAGASPAARPRLLIAGATGALGNEVLRRLAGSSAFDFTQVLTREPVTAALRGVLATQVPSETPQSWHPGSADVAVVLFDPPRMFYDRERALWTPQPEQLPELARWLRASGVGTLAVVLPHAPGRLPEALQRGLAGLDEQVVASLGFERVLFLRSAQTVLPVPHRSLPSRVAHAMLGVLKYMVPPSQQPVRARQVAELLSIALQQAPPGIHVAPPELVWRAAHGVMPDVARQWLHR